MRTLNLSALEVLQTIMLDFVFFSERLLWILGLIFTIYMIYYIFFLPFAFSKKNSYKAHNPKCRFAIIIAARNEQAVIANLIESLIAQDYPKDMFDVFVVPNNCTDNTEMVAREHGAKILKCTSPVSTKGQVLEQIIRQLFKMSKHDAICVFDADNVVDSGFLRAMNNAWCSGAKAAQGFRDSKNPKDTYISSSYSIYYWMVNRFYSHARSHAGLSAIINGSGFMADMGLLKSMGGWKTKTMTEDIEFTTKCILSNVPVAWVPEALTYDEQPLTFSQSWHQRSRWSTGIYQCLHYYSLPLIKGMFKNGFSGLRMNLDQLIFLLSPVLQLIWVLTIILGHFVRTISEHYGLSIGTPIFSRVILSIVVSFILSCVMSIVVMILERKSFADMSVGILSYWFFIMSWFPINAVCLFFRTKEWKAISHTRSVRVSEMK